jgi:thiamine biosynthesis protein ThiI
MVPFGKLQKKIATNLDIPSKYRTILYRRFMVRIAEKIVKREDAYGLVTGDNLGQVASQTAGNLFAVHNASTVPVYAPLIGYDKEEIIRIAEKIGTYEISKLPCKDTCSMFMPKSPELSAKTYDLARFEALLDVEKIVNDCVKNAEIIRFS